MGRAFAECRAGDLTQCRGVLEGFPEEVRFEMIPEGCVGVNQIER